MAEKIAKDWDSLLGDPRHLARNGNALLTSSDLAAAVGKKEMKTVLSTAMERVADGTAIFSDDFVAAMAEGKKHDLPKKLDDIVVDADEDAKPACAKKPKQNHDDDKENKPKREFANFMEEYASYDYYSDGERIMTPQKKVTDKTDDEGDDVKPAAMEKNTTVIKNKPEEEKKDKDSEAADEDLEIPEWVGSCVHCNRDPCIVNDEDASEEGREIVDWLNEEIVLGGINIPLRTFRFYLYRMYARHLHYGRCRRQLPECVTDYIDAHFREEGEGRTGFIANT